MTERKGGHRASSTALVLVGVLLGAALAVPATAHIDSVGHTWRQHLLPLAKKAFYTKRQTFNRAASDARYDSKSARPGTTETGVYSFGGSDAAGQFETTIEFDQKLPAEIPEDNLHFVTTPTTECPGPGQALAGHLCVYAVHQQNATFFDFFDPTDTAAHTASRQGVVMVFTGTGATPNGRGVWAVRPPS